MSTPRSAEHEASWNEAMPEIYDRCLGPVLFAPFAEHLAGRAAALAPPRVLELAAGTGRVTAELVRALPAAAITATDLNPAMVSWAAARIEGVDWRQADAQHLPFDAAAFELVLCQFGVMFFPDKATAFAEAARVLASDGTLLFAVWDDVRASPFAAAMVDSLAAVLPQDPPDFIVRIPHGYHDEARIGRDLESGGLQLQRAERVVLPGRAPSARSLAEGYCLGTPLRFALEQRGSLAELIPAITDQLTARLGDGPLDGALGAVVVSARHGR